MVCLLYYKLKVSFIFIPKVVWILGSPEQKYRRDIIIFVMKLSLLSQSDSTMTTGMINDRLTIVISSERCFLGLILASIKHF